MARAPSPATPLEQGYPARGERWIATGRAVLATVPPLLWWMGGYEVTEHQEIVHALMWGYLAYAWLMAALIVEMPAARRGLQLATHGADLVAYAVFTYLFEGQNSPFAFYFTFAIVAAAIRWGGRGALATAAIALTFYATISWHFLDQPGARFNTYQWTFRVVYLAVIAVLVGYLVAYESEWRREVSRLLGWSRGPGEPGSWDLESAVAHAAGLLRAPRLLVLWEEEDHPTVEVIQWSPVTFRRSRESPEILAGLMADPLREERFFCLDAAAPRPTVWRAAPGGVQRSELVPLRAEFRERFAVRQVLAIPLREQAVKGHLLALDQPRMTADDLVLGQIVAWDLVGRLEHDVLHRRLRQAAVTEERLRLAGDLHDGLLQSLSAAALHIQAAREKLSGRVDGAGEDLDKVQGLIRGEQHDLRFLIEALRPRPAQQAPLNGSLAKRLCDFAATVEKVWRVRVRLETSGVDGALAIAGEHELYRIVQEAVINAARHAGGTTVHVRVQRNGTDVAVSVTDDGHGFPFHGRFDHAELAAQALGPVSLRQRVTRLGGRLNVTSSPTGADVTIALPSSSLES
jgi:signal transduction histidine kinase